MESGFIAGPLPQAIFTDPNNSDIEIMLKKNLQAITVLALFVCVAVEMLHTARNTTNVAVVKGETLV